MTLFTEVDQMFRKNKPFVVDIVNGGRANELLEWVVSNYPRQNWDTLDAVGRSYFYFTFEKDAVLFKLRWA